jgi:hypothetical protein
MAYTMTPDALASTCNMYCVKVLAAEKTTHEAKIIAGQALAQAKMRWKAGDYPNDQTWSDWCKSHTPYKTEHVPNRLILIGTSANPVFEAERQLGLARTRKHLETKKLSAMRALTKTGVFDNAINDTAGTTNFDHLVRVWNKSSQNERRKFIDHIGAKL